jgi:hypothetical protein
MRRSRFLSASLVALALFGGCSSAMREPDEGPTLRTERDRFGIITCSAATATRTCFTHRTIMGLSMGASGAAQLGFLRPELFDGVGILGVPLVDWIYMLRNIQRSFLGGFCDRETILQNLDDVANPDGRAFCGPVPGEVKLEPSGRLIEPDQDFNRWYRWIDEGRGGAFGRNTLYMSLQDIALAYGNPVLYNPDSPYFPPGVPLDYRDRSDAERCATPLRIPGLFHKEYNPTGEFDAIAFCDTSTNDGDFSQARPSERATEILLAIDYNGNGIRDFAEPVITMVHERFEDIGTTPGDVYDWQLNPTGKAKNWIWDEGEPFEDYGLDGVPNTGDYGEGNGKFDINPNALNYLAHNPRSLIESGVSDGHLERLHIYADAGIRDFLQSAGGINWFWAALRSRLGGERVRDYTTFKALPASPSSVRYDAREVDWRPEVVGRHVYVRYGDPDASDREIRRGDGHHVGPADQALARFITSLAFFESRLLEPDRKQVREVADFDELVASRTYFSEALGEERAYGVIVPPGYGSPENSEKRYPVVYILHGQGQEARELLASALLFFGYMAEGSTPERMRRGESDWAKFIIVFPDSNCGLGGCQSGTFNTNHRGLDGNGPKYMDSLLELIAEIESSYRVALPVEVPR